MSGNLQGFDANVIDPGKSFDVVPAGEYDAVIVASNVMATSKGDGKLLKLELQILNGEFQNRKVFDNLNLWNPNEQTQQIARATLSSICRAVGIMTPGDSSELHNKPLRIKVVVKKSDEFGDQNKIKVYKPRSGQPAAQAQQAQSPQQNAAPWPQQSAQEAASRF